MCDERSLLVFFGALTLGLLAGFILCWSSKEQRQGEVGGFSNPLLRVLNAPIWTLSGVLVSFVGLCLLFGGLFVPGYLGIAIGNCGLPWTVDRVGLALGWLSGWLLRYLVGKFYWRRL